MTLGTVWVLVAPVPVHVSHGGLSLVEKAKICICDFRRFCIFSERGSCSVFDPIKGVSVCRLWRGGNFNTPKKVVVVDEPVSRLNRKGSL